MYSTSTDYMRHVLSNSREWDIYIDITLLNGTTIRLTKNNISLGHTQLKEGATCSDTIQIGSTFANSFEFTILNSEGQYTKYDFYKAKVQPYVGLYISTTGKQAFEYVPLGEFWILENVKKLSTIPIVCFDHMSLTNQPFDFSDLVFPASCATVFNKLVAQCGITVSSSLTQEISQLTYQINSMITDDPSCRDILAGFGVMLQKNLRFNRTGVLESFWYTNVPQTNLGNGLAYGTTSKSTRVGNSSYGDDQITVTGVYVEDAYGNVFSAGTEEYAIELPTSPILQGSEMCEPIVAAALQQLRSTTYRPSAITYSGDPALQAGDVLLHTGTAVGDITLPVMRLVYKFAGTCTLESLGVDEATHHQETVSNKKLKKAFARADKDRAELESLIGQTAEEVLIRVSESYVSKEDQATFAVRVDEIAAEVVRQEETIDGIQSDLTSVKQSADGLSVSVQHIIDNGAEKVTTKEARYTFDDQGLNISKSGEEMANKLDNTGMYVTRSGETILQANNAGVVAVDVTVRNYLVIGKNARFEDYSDGVDTKRTACFFVQ